MTVKIPWDKYEIALLIESYFWVDNGEIDRAVAVEVISEELRLKAQNVGHKIDDIYRNKNGIRMQMYGIQYIVTNGNTGLKNSNKLFKNMVNLYLNKPENFNEIVQEAKSMINENSLQQKDFIDWLSKRLPVEQVSQLKNILRIFNVLGRKQRLFKESLFRIESTEELSVVRSEVIDNNALKVQKKKLYDFYSIFCLYDEYLNDKSCQDNKELNCTPSQQRISGRRITFNDKANEFYFWMVNNQGLAERSGRNYASAINGVSQFAQKYCDLEKPIYEINDSERVEEIMSILYMNQSFIKLNKQGHNRFSGALAKYLLFLKNEDNFLMDTSTPVENYDNEMVLNIEKEIKLANLDGISAKSIADNVRKSVSKVKCLLKTREYAVEMPGDLYVHVENIIDIEENAEKILKILQSQFKKFAGYTNDVVLYSTASISLNMFLNDNCLNTPEKLYRVAKFLFEKIKFDGYEFVFGADKHIWEKRPEFTLTNSGVLINYITYSGGIISKEECVDFLSKVKLPAGNINGLLEIGTNQQVLLCDSNKYVLARNIIENDLWLVEVKNNISKLFKQASYIIPREIAPHWFDTLPVLPNGWNWSLLLLQELIKKYISEYRLISANENQGLETLRPGIVPMDSYIENFADLVYVRIMEDNLIQLPMRIRTEEFRQKLIGYGMIQGSELLYTMEKSLDDARYAWASDGSSVLILKKY